MTSQDHDLLSSSLEGAQELSRDAAEKLATKILALDADIAEAAIEWARTGVMPVSPVILDESPQSMNEAFYPSQVFTALAYMRHEGPDALRRLSHAPGRSRPPRPFLD